MSQVTLATSAPTLPTVEGEVQLTEKERTELSKKLDDRNVVACLAPQISPARTIINAATRLHTHVAGIVATYAMKLTPTLCSHVREIVERANENKSRPKICGRFLVVE